MKRKYAPQQVHIAIPVVVRGKIGNLPFEQATTTTSVNPNGCTVTLAARPSKGQQFLMVNALTKEERTCTVRFVDRKGGDRIIVVMDFAEFPLGFWPVRFPPKDQVLLEYANG